MTEAHTPDPWKMRLSPYPDGTPFCIIEAGEGCYDANSDGSDTGFEIRGILSVANARLISASPMLLAAARWARDFIDTNWELFAKNETKEGIEAALKQAEALDVALRLAGPDPMKKEPK